MVTKSKPKPKAKDPIAELESLGLLTAPELTAADREAAFEQFLGDCPSLVKLAGEQDTPEHAVELLTNRHASWQANLAHFPAEGEPKLTLREDGIFAELDGRRGTIGWPDVAEAIRTGDIPEPEAGSGAKRATNGSGPRAKPRKRQPSPATSPVAEGLPPASPAASRSLSPYDRVAAGQSIPIGAIRPSPYQNRRDFDKETLKQLAEEIKTHGLLQPIVVRPLLPGFNVGYELVAGERRLRAAKLAGWTTIAAMVRVMTDEEAAEAVLAENLFRQDLNALEEAHGYQGLVALGHTQQAIAERFGTTQANISNKLRLLELPEAWQKKIISQEISGTHARALVPFARHPKILHELATLLKRDGDCGSVADWQEAIDQAVWDHGRKLKGQFLDKKRGWCDIAFTPTPEQVAKLDVVEIRHWGDKHQVALNLALWGTLQAAGEKKKAEAEAKREAKAAAAGKKTAKATKHPPGGGRPRPGGYTKPRPKPVDLVKVYERKLGEWRLDWLLYLAAAKFGAAAPGLGVMTAAHRLLFYLAFHRGIRCGHNEWGSTREWHLFDRREDVLKEAGGANLATRGDEGLTELTTAVAARICYGEKDGPRRYLPARVIEALAAELKLNLAASWKQELAGPLTSQYFEMHTKEKLLALGKELGAPLGGGSSKSELVKLLAKSPATKKKLPQEIGGIKKK